MVIPDDSIQTWKLLPLPERAPITYLLTYYLFSFMHQQHSLPFLQSLNISTFILFLHLFPSYHLLNQIHNFSHMDHYIQFAFIVNCFDHNSDIIRFIESC